jgi:hypothetical protein
VTPIRLEAGDDVNQRAVPEVEKPPREYDWKFVGDCEALPMHGSADLVWLVIRGPQLLGAHRRHSSVTDLQL